MTTIAIALRRSLVFLLSWALVATMAVTGALPTREAHADGPSLTATVTLKQLNKPQVATIEVTPRYWEAGDAVTITVTPTVGSMECTTGAARPVAAGDIRIDGSSTHTSWSPSTSTDYMDAKLWVNYAWENGVQWRTRSKPINGGTATRTEPLAGTFSTTFTATGGHLPYVRIYGGTGAPMEVPVSESGPPCEGWSSSATDINWNYPAMPIPAYDWSVAPGTRTVTFTDRTIMDIGEQRSSNSVSWLFGDTTNNYASGPSSTHTYPEDGEYTITHSVYDRFGRSAEVQTKIRVGDEPMQGALFERPPSTTGDTIKEGETLPLRLRVENHDAIKLDATPPEDGWFTEVKVESAKVVAVDEEGNPIEEPVDPPLPDPGGEGGPGGGEGAEPSQPVATLARVGDALPTEIDPRSSGSWGQAFTDFDLVGNRAGDAQVQVKVSATRSNGEAISKTFTFNVTVKPSPLTVTIVQDPAALVYGQDNDKDDAITDADNEFDIKVTVTNNSDAPVTSIDSTDLAQPLRFTGKIGDLAAAVALERLDSEGSSFGDLAPGAEKTITYRYRAADRVLADAKYVVAGVQNGKTVSAHGVKEIKVSKELWLEAEFGTEDRPFKSGQTVRLNGTIKNVTKVLGPNKEVVEEGFTVGVLIEPTLEGNAGGGELFEASYGGQTPLTPTPFTLEPDQELDLAAVLGTMETDQPTAATVTYHVHVYKLEDPTDPIEGDDTNYTISAGTERQSVALTPVPKSADEWLRCPAELNIISFLSCRFTLGVKSFSVGLWNLAAVVAYGTGQAAKAYWGVLATEIWAMGQIIDALLGDDAALDRLAQEILIDVQALKDVGVQSLKAITPTHAGVKAAVFGALDALGKKMHKNSLREWAGDLTEFAGANLDSSGALANMVVKRVTLKVMAGAAGREGAERAALEAVSREQAESLTTRVASAEAAGMDLTEGVFKAGDDVTGMTKVLEAFGAGSRDVANMLKIAKQEGVNLLFRARQAKSIQLLEQGLAWAKPSGISIKTVSEIDIKFLGYQLEWEARAVLVEPPIKWKPAGAERNAAIEQYLNGFSELQGTSGAARDMRAAVKSRLEQRMDEWPVQLQKFSGYAQHGVDASFYTEKQGLKKGLIANESKLRKAEVIPESLAGVGGAGERRVFQLKMAGPDGVMKWITGDIDFLAILNPDGSILQDIAKRTRIYESMRSLLGMQHGESMTFSGSEKLRQQFLACCSADGETMLAATFDGRVVATNFDDALAVMPEGLNAAMLPTPVADRIDSLVYLTGVTAEMVSAARAGANVPLPPIKDFVAKFIAGKMIPIPTDLKGVMEALAKLESKVNGPKPAKPATFDRNGKPIAASGKATASGPDFVPVIYTVNEKTGQFDRFRSPGRAFVTSAAGSSYSTATAFRAEPPSPSDALSQSWDELVADGYPQPDVGSWRALTEADLDAVGDAPGVAPFTLIGADAAAGDVMLDLLTADDLGVAAGSPFFQVGDRIVIDPATDGEEFAIVRTYDAATGAMTLVSPLKTAHLLASRVLYLAPGTVPGGSDTGSGSDNGGGSGGDTAPQAPPVTTTVPAGGTASSAPGGALTAANPVIVKVTSPVAGQISFSAGGDAAPEQGYSMLGRSIVITAPPATAADPLRLSFDVALQAAPEGTAADELVVFRNGVPVPRCTEPKARAASPDPCVAAVRVTGTVVSVDVRTSRASVWTVGAPAVELAGQRVAGLDRYETSALIAKRFGTSQAVILANGSNARAGADALAANVLAGRVKAPILLTEAESVAPSVLSAVRAVLAGVSSPVIYVMGGVDSVSDAAVAQARAAASGVAAGTVRIVRVAGSDRYATAAAAASYGDTAAGTVRPSATEPTRRTAILASGVVSADALAAGPLSFAWGLPVLLTGAAGLNSAARSVIVAQGITQLIVLGGVDRISQRALDDARAAGVTSIKRIAGSDRFATAAQLYAFVADVALGPDGTHYGARVSAPAAYLANGHAGFPDALSAGPLAGKEEAALLTVGPLSLPPQTRDYLTVRGSAIDKIVVLGRSPTVSAGVVAAANTAVAARASR